MQQDQDLGENRAKASNFFTQSQENISKKTIAAPQLAQETVMLDRVATFKSERRVLNLHPN